MAGRRHKSPPSGTSRKNRHETHDSTASVDLPYLPHDFFGNPPSNQPPDFDKKQASLIQKMLKKGDHLYHFGVELWSLRYDQIKYFQHYGQRKQIVTKNEFLTYHSIIHEM